MEGKRNELLTLKVEVLEERIAPLLSVPAGDGNGDGRGGGRA